MDKQLKVEHYLLQLDRELQALPVSQRAEIITEIKSHIREATENTPGGNVDPVLAGLGTPRQVAEKYLAAKGVSYQAPRAGGGRRMLKWLAIGTVAFFGFIFVSGLTLAWYFSPLVKVDEKEGRVVLLGGLIDVNEDLGQVRIGDMVVNDAIKEGLEAHGEEDLATNPVTEIVIPFNTAKLEINSSTDKRVIWDCKGAAPQAPKAEIQAGVMTLNLDVLNFAKCAISLPEGLSAKIHGTNGKVDVHTPRANMDIALVNGKVEVKTDEAREYDFDVKVKNGLQDFFPRSGKPDALKVKISVVNGMVKNE